jgi:hypothetical protein
MSTNDNAAEDSRREGFPCVSDYRPHSGARSLSFQARGFSFTCSLSLEDVEARPERTTALGLFVN